MTSLQERLDKAFGALSPTEGGAAAAWKPQQQQIFRSGAVDDAQVSSDEEEFNERARREAVPGLAQSLAEEDEPDEEGFRPSTAFCRALDAEDDYDLNDEIATGQIERRQGGEALPPRGTQVLADNPYEQLSSQRDQAAAAGGPASEAAADQQAMEVEEPAAPVQPAGPGEAAPAGSAPAAAAGMHRRARSGGLASPRSSDDGARQKKTVRFEGVAAAYVPPSRRPGYQPRCTELPPGEGDDAPPANQQQQQQGSRPQRGQGLSVVPEHVKHPDKYTCYTLDEPLLVGGGVGQLSSAGQRHDVPSSAAPAAGMEEQQAEPERWEGPVGRGAVEFRPRQPRAAGDAGGGEGKAAPAPAAGRQQQALQLAFQDDAEGQAEGEAEGAGLEAAAAGGSGPADVTMAEGAAPAARSKRHYRSTRRAADD